MLRVLRSARAASAIMRPRTTPNVARAVSTTPRVLAGHPAPPAFVGGGSPAGEVPTEDTQATGLERFEILGANEGIDVFDMSPLEMTRMGTMADPIKIRTIVGERQVGCTGYPVDSHNTLWTTMNSKYPRHRCHECGCVYELVQEGNAHEHH